MLPLPVSAGEAVIVPYMDKKVMNLFKEEELKRNAKTKKIVLLPSKSARMVESWVVQILI